jgi:malonyl-CoA O-methyltransferase
VVQALLAVDSPGLEATIGRACGYLHARIGAQGAVVPEIGGGSLDLWAAPALRLVCLPALFQAAERFGQPAWKQSVWRAVAWCRRTMDLTRWNAPSHLFAQQLSAMLDLGMVDETRRAMQLPAAVQRRDGSVPAWSNEAWVSSAGLAQFAVLWYRLGDRDRPDRAVACLRRQQHADGGFAGSWGRGARFHAARQTAATALHALEAARWQVQACFAAEQSQIEETIDPRDGRVQAVRRLIADLPPGARVADVGCGKGRFLRHLTKWFPHIRFTGIDASPQLLRYLPAGVEAVPGNLHDLPCGAGTFDAAFAVESLEHALLPRHAASELCRIVRPGGQVIVIDKQRSHQPLSQHEPWERWFAADELSNWLSPFCDGVDVAATAHAHHQRPTGLFLCWSATRRQAAGVRYAA